MTSISSLNGPRVQPTTTSASSAVANTRFGSLMQGAQSQAGRPGDALSGNTVVSSALSQMGAQPNGALLGTYMMGAIKGQGAGPGAPAAAPTGEEAKAMQNLAIMSAASMSRAILGMGNGMKISLETE